MVGFFLVIAHMLGNSRYTSFNCEVDQVFPEMSTTSDVWTREASAAGF